MQIKRLLDDQDIPRQSRQIAANTKHGNETRGYTRRAQREGSGAL